jgi:hypothetical protein
MEIAQTAAEAFDRYEMFLHEGRLVQASWHAEDNDGRELACGLGVLGPDMGSPSQCPAAVMPRWLAQMVPWLFDNQTPENAFAWGERFYAELKRLDGQVPFSVVYDWQANVVQPLGLEWAEERGDKALIEAVQALHARALAGDTASVEEWKATLRPALRQVYAYANAYAYTYADADADADAYAYTNADAYAYTYADADAYADAYAYTYADAYAYRKHIARLADGLVECLKRVQP